MTGKITVQELAYIRMQAPNLDQAEQSFLNFGLLTRERSAERLCLRTHGAEHPVLDVRRGNQRFLAIGFEVDEEAMGRAACLEGASPNLESDDLSCGPRVRINDVDGNVIELVPGRSRAEPVVFRSPAMNRGGAGLHRVNALVRPPRTPSRVVRLGHIVLTSPDVSRLSGWYQKTLGLLESDDVTDADGVEVVMSFARLNQGAVPVDHHVMQFVKGDRQMVHHISFEVMDIDDLHVGHEVLRSAGYEHVWGIGRHLQGSQIFDYWRDPFGVMYEHWTDTDRLDASVASGRVAITKMHGAWGPEPSAGFKFQATR